MLKDRIKAGEKLIGCYTELTDPAISRIEGLCGYDYVWIDMEHTYLSYETVFTHILTLHGTSTPVIVRVPKDDLTVTKKVLEMGVDGIIFPQPESAEEAARVISYSLYPPDGVRGFGPMGAVDFGLRDATAYMKASRDTLCRFIQIEHRGAVRELDRIMENPFIDGYIFGPNDLAASYGLPGGAFSDEISAVIRDVTRRLHEKGKYVGIASGSYAEDVVKHWCSFGVEMLTAGADVDFLREGALANRAVMARLLKGEI